MACALACLIATLASAADYKPPAGTRTAMRRPAAESILPGGRIVSPIGKVFTTGPGSHGLAISPNGRAAATNDGGPKRQSVTLVSQGDHGRWQTSAFRPFEAADSGDDDWISVFMGIAWADDKSIIVSEGNTGRIRHVDAKTGGKRFTYHLNGGEFRDSFSADLAYDRARELLYVIDQANFRLAIFDTKRKRQTASLRVGRMPFAIALAPGGKYVYVTNVGMFEYKPLPGADPKRPQDTGISFPAFGFPSPEASAGVTTKDIAGNDIAVPGLGDPNVPESNSVAFINVENPAAPKIEGFVRTGLPFGDKSLGGSSPSGVLATKDRVYVSNAHNDTVTVIEASTRQVLQEVQIRIPGLEQLRGVLPLGMAFHEASGWLLVAEAGINAIGVIDTKKGAVIGHIPAGWFPSKIALQGDTVYSTNAKGHGTGPNATKEGPVSSSFQAILRRGSLSVFPLPDEGSLLRYTQQVYSNNGFNAAKEPALAIPSGIRHVVVIVKENRTYDEVFGDIQNASNGPATGVWDLARFGQYGTVRSNSPGLQSRFSLRSVNVTPNHHALAGQFAFSDNFYADSEMSVDGHHWLVGSYPDAWVETTIMGPKEFRMPTAAPGRLRNIGSNSSVHPDDQLENGTLWHHLERHGISFRNYGEGFELASVDEGPGLKPTGARFFVNVPMPAPLFKNTARDYPQYNTNIPDQFRAAKFIADIEQRFVKTNAELPRLLYIHLPNDHMAKPRPEDGYPFEASYVADNDVALGRIIEYLSKSKWWGQMAVFITEDDAQGGVDHIDSHRTVMMVASPFAKRNYVSHVNSSFPGLLKTVFRIFGLPPLNLFDASAADLADCFTNKPDFAPYELKQVWPELFDPAKAKDPADPVPGPRMDDPKFLEEQHRRK